MHHELRAFLIYLACGLLYCYFVFCPTLICLYANHDQYRFFDQRSNRQDEGRMVHDPFFGWLWSAGRPISAIIEDTQYTKIHTLSDLRRVRMVVVALTALMLALWALWLHSQNFDKAASFFISAAVFTLPAAQFWIFHAVIPNILAVLLAFSSSVLIHRFGSPFPLNNAKRFLGQSAIVYILALSLLLAAMLTYPAKAYFFLVPSLITVLFKDANHWGRIRRWVVRDLVFLGLGSLLYFVIVRAFLQDPGRHFPATYEFKLTGNVLSKVPAFLSGVSVEALNVWNVYGNKTVACVVIAILLSGAVSRMLLLIRRESDGNTRPRLCRYAVEVFCAVMALLLAGNIPFLVAASNLSLHRTRFVYTAMIVLLIVWAVKAYTEWLPERFRDKSFVVLTGLMMIGSGMYASFTTLMNVSNARMEINFVSTQIASHLDRPIRRIHVIQPGDPGRGYNGLPSITDEFNRNSLHYPWYVPEIVRAALLQVADGKSFITEASPYTRQGIEQVAPDRIAITYSQQGEPVIESPDTIVIDMNDLLLLSKKPKGKVLRWIEFSTSGPPQGASVFMKSALPWGTLTFQEIINEHAYPFWEVSGVPYPHWLRVDFSSKPMTIEEYGLAAGTGSTEFWTRMPTDWRLQGSNQENSWVDLDTRSKEEKWREREERIYKVAKPGAYKSYRFYFTDGSTLDIMRVTEIKITISDGNH